ncbi:MAG: alanine--tRNA ligase, partial [Deferribacterales bacterium]|nr:alanine--tRNA ligase [Deferribacterales bacterium]
QQISSIEKEVNNIIFQGLMVKKRVEDIQDAIDSGATALFGEKYSDIVRVVEVDGYSVELCGGCHTDNTVSIGLFKIISESSVASGVRRIEALTGSKALEYLSEAECINKNIGAMLKCSQGEIVSRVSDLIENAKETERLKKEAEDRIAARPAGKMADDAREINGIKALSVKLNMVSADGMRNMVDSLRDKLGSCVVLVAGETDGKLILVCGVSKDLTSKYKAGAIVKETAKIAGGSGGGKDDMAQAGAKDVSKLEELLEKFYSIVASV